VFDFGLRIQELRMKHNLSQSELGKKINKSKTAIWGYENNVRIPPLEALVDIAVVLNVSLPFCAVEYIIYVILKPGGTPYDKITEIAGTGLHADQ